MADMGFSPAKTQVFLHMNGRVPFDVFVKMADDRFVRIFKKHDQLERRRLQNYFQKGAEFLYFRENDQESFFRFGRVLIERLRSTRGFEKEGADIVLDEIADQALSQILKTKNFSYVTIETIVSIASAYVDIATFQPQILPQLIRLARTKPILIRHGILSAIFSTLLARTKSPGDSRFQVVCGLAGLLHDIGFSQLSADLDESAENLSPQQILELKKHPQLGADLVQSSTLPAGVRTAILQHHEAYDGTGYPMGLSGESISLPARIIAIANAFVSLTTGTSTTAAVPIEVAISIISNDSKLDSNLFSTFTQMLRVA